MKRVLLCSALTAILLCISLVPPRVLAQDDRGQQSFVQIASVRTSPFDPPEEDVFVADAGPGLDTGCTFNDSPGHPLMIDVIVDQFVGPVDGNGYLVNPDPLIAEGIIPASVSVIMPAFDVDVNGPAPPEHDEVLFNGESLGLLNGDNNIWLLNSFTVDVRKLKFPAATGGTATNRVQINIDVLSSGRWCTAIDWVAFVVPIRPKIALKLTALGGNKVREIADDVIYEQSFDADCNVTTDIGPFDDFPFSGSANKEVTLRTEIELCPDTGEQPDVKAEWTVRGAPPLETSGTTSWTGDVGDVKVKMLDRVNVATADVTYEIDGQTATVSRRVFVTRNDPLAAVSPPRKAWYEKAVPWGQGPGVGSTDEAQTLENLLGGLYTFGNSNWRYGYNFGGVPKCTWEPMVADPITCDYADCYVFSDIFENMAAVLGVGGLAVIQELGANGSGFMTTGAPSLDPAFPGNSRPFAGGAFDRYLFSSHSLRHKGRFYDATFNGIYATQTQFIAWNINGSATDADGPHFTTDEGAKIYPLAAPGYDSWGTSAYKTPPASPRIASAAQLPLEMQVQGTTAFSVSAQNVTFTGNNTFTEVDDDGDGFFEALRANVEIETTATGDYVVYGVLQKGGVAIARRPAFESMLLSSTTFANGAGTHVVDLEFSGEQIYRSGEDGPYDLVLHAVGSTGDSGEGTFLTPAVDHTRYGELPAVLTGAVDDAVDVDGDGDFDFVQVSATVAVRVGGDVGLQGDLSKNAVSLVDAGDTFNLPAGTHTVVLPFIGTALRRAGLDGPYEATINLKDESGHTLQTLRLTTQAYSSGNFGALLHLDGTFEDRGIDTNGNGLFDLLRTEFGADVQAAGTYLISGQLTGPAGEFVAFSDVSMTLGAGPQTLSLDFSGPAIRTQGVDGPYDLEVVLRDPVTHEELDRVAVGSRTAGYDAASFEPFGAADILLTGTTSDQGVDTDGDGLFDQLTVGVDVALTTTDFYRWSARLVDANGTEIDFDARSGILNAGTATIHFVFDGVQVGNNGVDGPYFVKGLLMFGRGGANVVVTSVAETQAYDVSQFESTNRPPTADSGDDQTVECTGPGGGAVTLDATGSSDPDGDALTYTWRENGEIIAGPTTDARVDVSLALGVHEVELSVADPFGAADTDVVEITVVDTTPPEIEVASEPIVLWPPNHAYHTIDLSSIVTSVFDACDGDLSASDVFIKSVSSDEPENGEGDGNTVDDVVIGEGCTSTQLRAERDARGNGRVYTILLAAVDASGNEGQASFQVHVPLDARPNATATDDGAIYTVAGCTSPGSGAARRVATSREEGVGGRLLQNYPNPFNPSTEIRFVLSETQTVRLVVYDVRGREIERLVDGTFRPGEHRVTWDALDMPSGVYFYRLTAGDFVEVQRMILTK